VGQKIGQFVALEIKTPTGRARQDQHDFIEHVRSRGGLADIVRSPQDAIDTLEQAMI
jgi:hypothetical protein